MNRSNIWIIICVLILQTIPLWGQEKLNSVDIEGQKHGYWKEFFDNKKTQLKYEGQFHHGKRTGLFKYYQEGLKQPVAIMDFDPSTGRIVAKYLSQNGKVISEGEMYDRERTGLWTYYHKDSDQVMMTENYKNGKLHGPKKIYYDKGQLAEEATYMNGELHGSRKLFSVKGIVLEDLTYKSGELHGPAKFFNGQGLLMSEGVYRNDKHHGTWLYYENGEFTEEKDF
ncbi:toxin-antitoxin system YwqK family antitoxin [Salinimicrobium terrae]|uniref:toxin-antitoxin system YwqK family antitoxin n=1 Tax=Salinimicrobium terrae TaxID=470866 RepID=UPI0005609606|nr:hypothetical protein [Salinimicrobium terrae]